VVCRVETTTESLTAFESAIEAFNAALVAMLRAVESGLPASAVDCADEIKADCETSFESAVVCRVDMTAESLTALESANAAADPALTPLLSAVDVSNESDTALLSATEALSAALVAILRATESGLPPSAADWAEEISNDWETSFESDVVCSVEITALSLTAFESATEAAVPALTALLSANDVNAESDTAFESAVLAAPPALVAPEPASEIKPLCDESLLLTADSNPEVISESLTAF